MEAAAGTLAVLDAARAADAPCTGLGAEVLLVELETWEAIGRLVDAHRITLAAEVDARSRATLGEGGLAFQHGARHGENLVADLARVSVSEAHRRVALGTHLAPRPSLAGEPLPGVHPLIADAVHDGTVGVESARMLVEAVRRFRRKAPREAADVAERLLVEEAGTIGPDLLRIHIETWTALLDPDGSKGDEQQQHRKRAVRIAAKPDEHGMSRLTAILTPEDAATIRAALLAHRASRVQVKLPPGEEGEGCDELGSHWQEADGERRTLPQQDSDAFIATFTTGIRAETAGWDGRAKTPHEVLVHANAQDLLDGSGSAWTDGVLARLSIPTVTRMLCDGSMRLVVLDDGGEPLHLGRTTRRFSPAQRKALVARWHGCAFPRCTAPTAWTHAHHIEWWTADEGPSDITNGVLLCSYHHHLIHAGTSPWRMVLHDRQPHLIPNNWRGPPGPQHRLRPRPVPLGRSSGLPGSARP